MVHVVMVAMLARATPTGRLLHVLSSAPRLPVGLCEVHEIARVDPFGLDERCLQRVEVETTTAQDHFSRPIEGSVTGRPAATAMSAVPVHVGGATAAPGGGVGRRTRSVEERASFAGHAHPSRGGRRRRRGAVRARRRCVGTSW